MPLEEANPDLSARELIDRAAARVAQIDERQPLVRAQMMHTLGGLYIRLGIYDRARQTLIDGALALRRQHLGSALEIAETLLLLGMAQNHLGDHAGAESFGPRGRHDRRTGARRRALGRRVRADRARHLRAPSAALRRGQQIFERAAAIYRRTPAKAMGAPTNALGLIRAEFGDLDGAIGYYREALAINVARFGVGPSARADQSRQPGVRAPAAAARRGKRKPCCASVVAARRRRSGTSILIWASGLPQLAVAVVALGRAAAAEPLLRRGARDLRAAISGRPSADCRGTAAPGSRQDRPATDTGAR